MANRFIADQLTDEFMVTDIRFLAHRLTDEFMVTDEFMDTRFLADRLTDEFMAESNRDIADQFESRILQSNSRRILSEGKHRWLRPDEICEVLRNPNGIAISEKPAVMPPSGSIFVFDKKVQKHFRNDGYKWKKAKDGRTKEGHEKLKVEGCDTLHCYYAHGEEYQKFQRRSYWMLDENLSHMVLVHYRDVKGEKRKAKSIKEIETAEGVQHSHETDETTPNSEMDSFASFSFNPSNFQHSQATDGTNLNSAQTSESENTESAYNHQANFGLPRLPKLQHAMAKINAGFPDTLIRTNCNEREVKEAVSSCFVPTNFQMPSQAIDTESLSGLSTSDFEDAQSACDDYRCESFFSKTVNTGFSDTTSLYSANSSNFGDDETEHSFADDFSSEALLHDLTCAIPLWMFPEAISSVAVEPSPLGKRQREGKFQATHNAIMEEVDEEKDEDEEEEGNNINQVRKRPKVTCGQKSNSVAPSNDSEEATLAVGTAHPQVQQFNFAIQQGEVIAGNNPAASDVAVTIDRTITDGAMNDATALSQDDETTRLAAFHIADPTVAATSAVGPIHLNPCTITNVGDQAQPPVPQPTATIGVDIAATTNKTAAPESSDPDLVQTRPTSNANQDFVQDVESQERETEPTSFEPKNGKGKIMVQRDVGTEKFQIQDSSSILQAQEDDATTRLAAFSITDPSGAASLTRGPIHLNPDTIANVVDQVQDSQPTVTTGIVISATINETAASESSNHALVQWEPTSNANQDLAQDVVEAQEDDATTRLVAFSITDPSGAASLARGPIHLNPDTIANVVDQAQDSQPTVTTGIVISATINETSASESSNHALVQWEPTSNANQDFAQDVVESQEKGTEPTSIEPENGKSKAVVQRDFGTVTRKSHEFSEVVMSSHKRLHQLLDRASAPNTLPSSSRSTPTIDSQAIATTGATLEMDFITMASEVQRTRMISSIQSVVDSNCFPIGTRPMILAMLKQLEQSILAYSEAYSEYDMGKNLTDQVEASKQLLQPRVQLCDSKEKEFQELEEKKMKIEARQAAILAEIHGAVIETEPIQAHLEKLLLQQDQFKESEGNLRNILDIGRGLWTSLKSIIHRNLPM